MVTPVLPRAQAAIADTARRPTPEWFEFFRNLLQFVNESGLLDPGVIADILARLDALEQEGDTFTIQGLMTVTVAGTPEGGVVQIFLVGDVDDPGNTYYYGTGPTGEKGWFPVADAIAVEADEIEKTVGTDGVTTLGLADLTDTGTGTFQLITRDAKGRVEGTDDGEAVDVPYDNGASGLSATDVQGAIDEIAASSGGGAANPAISLIDPMMDFLGKPPTSITAAAGASYGWLTTNIATAGSISSINGGATAPGVWQLNCGSSTSGITCITMGSVNNFTIGAGPVTITFRFRVPTLSVLAQRFSIAVGLRSNFIGPANERIEVDYTDDVNGGNLVLSASVGGASTAANGTTAVATNTWVSGRIVINAAGTQADLYINNSATPEATITTGMPTGVMSLGALIAKSTGTTARTLDLDYLDIQQTFTTPR